jgi:predicted CXXCH cytochrome family protein
MGSITGQDATGRPVAANCMLCHNDDTATDNFTPWAQTGHAEIFTANLDTSSYYSDSCFACHSVGFDPTAENGGFDEADDYADFIDAGLLGVPGDNWTTVVNEFPDTAQLANIQCENCHGPQGSAAHMALAPRVSLSADVCATCHGEPLRHARFQQWQLSGHANYELAIDEGTNGSCARCHTVNGFLAWLPVLLDEDPATDPLADVEVTWTADQTHPQTCVTCHDPHAPGSTTGVDTNATVRITGDTPPLIGGFTVIGAGKGAICMTCHNTRRGLRNDGNFDDIYGTSDASRAPHQSAQADVLMGENAYLVEAGIRGSHSLVTDTCVNCHMNQTPPPDLLSYQLSGTNHTFFASRDICSQCHGDAFDADGVQSAYEALSETLKGLVEDRILDLVADQIALGNSIDLNALATITDIADIESIEFSDTSGRQAIGVTFTDGRVIDPVGMNNVNVLDGTGTDIGDFYNFADARLIKAGWNWALTEGDRSRGVHNPTFVLEALDAGIDALNDLAAE